MDYEVRAKHNPLWLMASGFHGDTGRDRAQKMVDSQYWEPYLMPQDKGTEFVVVASTAQPSEADL